MRRSMPPKQDLKQLPDRYLTGLLPGIVFFDAKRV